MKRFRWLEKKIREYKFQKGLGVEVGTGKGITGSHLLGKFPELKMIQVAWYPNQSGYQDATPRAREKWEHRVLKPFEKRIILIEKESVEASVEVADGSVDFVFIDADHSYEHVLADLIAWFPKVKKGGFISGHDYCQPDFPGVKKALKDFFSDGKKFKGEREHDFVWSYHVELD